jgi:hypothetical protein
MRKLFLLLLSLIILKTNAQDLDNGLHFTTKEIQVTKSDINSARIFIKENLDDFNKKAKIQNRTKLNRVLDSLIKKQVSVKIEEIYFDGHTIKQQYISSGTIIGQITKKKKPFCFFNVKKSKNMILLIVLFGDDCL